MKYTVPQVLAAAVSVMVVAAVVTGFIVAGSPALERARRFDDQRVSALQQIANAIGVYVETRHAVPASLADVQTAASKGLGIYLPELKDPATQAMYEYTVTSTLTYRLCANFEATPRPVDPNAGMAYPLGLGTPDFAKHPVGHFCWDIDLTERSAKAKMLPTGTVVPAPVNGADGVVPMPVETAPNVVGVPAEPTPVAVPPANDKTVDSCILMKNDQNGAVACYGCANDVCTGSSAEWKPYAPSGNVGIPYACFAGPNGCELAQ